MKKTMSFIILFALCTCLYKPVIHVSSSKLLNQRVIVLDPGHGGLDNGASVAGVDEDTLNLKISFALKEELESRGATVYMTRTDDQDMTKRNYNYSKQDDMYLRALQVDAYQPDLFLSIHLNSSTSSAWGSQVFYYKKSEDGKRLANCIHDQMKTLTGTRKNVSSSSFYILRATQSLGVLIECGFLSNANERGQLKSRAYHQKLAIVISDGIEDYFHSLAAPL
ncbi:MULTISPECIES: N-acetylmuramoyl-L-alanine amidase [Bacillota]|uniref:N-acetylmuramoyl-L-alanine amidase n=1 Tax=Massilimicrobiota timonensis TaxID=1776392 RepID=A0A1Y4SZW6_9FIRM|nr:MULTISPECIES: N-acetylmuramoyl-L-alanine amidase [Bacillota]MBM6965679.1 N-acetylmuramoyl-L-alanine amidase [Massilimicrobiota timonensis]OUQ34491.1 N-acetylmuramoyl-L-alanine amidase [Massilimicrobiota timonensis]QUN12772.1 N-acetylmuramoyl-L-alanine amidase [Clostridium sp. C1]